MLSVGIVGLPNVGKSTLFNALLKKQVAYVANYPFTTIEPNIGVVPVPDDRLLKLAEVKKVANKMPQLPPIIPATVNFVDIAGLVKDASKGAGLGNKFLAHIREVNVIAHVVRVFEDENIIKEGSVDPRSDYQIINQELALADLSTISKFIRQLADQSAKSQSKIQKEAIDKVYAILNEGKPAREVSLSAGEKEEVKQLFLLTMKSEIVVLNVAESDYNSSMVRTIEQKYARWLEVPAVRIIAISAKIEAELAALSDAEQKEYLKGLGLEKSGLERLIQKAYDTLGLISFLTEGRGEVRAWTIQKGTLAAQAAGVIHTDFEKHFIKADVVPFTLFVQLGGWLNAREQGKVLSVGRDYQVKDGDVIEFKVGV